MWPKLPFRLLSRTSGFRLALRSLALSLAGAVLVFAIIHHAAETSWRDQIDGAVAGALSDIRSDIQNNKQSLSWNVQQTLAEGGGLFYGAFSPSGAWLAGNLHINGPAALGWTGYKTLHRNDGFLLARRVTAIRGIAQKFPNGDTLVIAADASALQALSKLIARSFLAVFGTIMALGLLSGYLTANSALSRIDHFANTIREIMEGDLSRRIEISRSGDEFDRLAASMNAMLQRIQELMENLKQVTNDISHDLRSPLARLREHLELSRPRFTGPEADAMFDEALAQIDQALGIFSAMLQIAEIEAGARRSRFAPVQLSPLLESIAESYEPSFTAAGIEIETAIAPELMLSGDKALLTQLVANLLDNIILHAQNTTIAIIRAARHGAQVRITISDNGCGIPAGEHSRAVQRFVRLDAARNQPGNGLGLALALAITGLHGGQMQLEDHKPGLTVYIDLPMKS